MAKASDKSNKSSAGRPTKFATHQGVITDEREYIKHYPPDPAAAIFWLKNRQPKRWRDRIVNEHEGNLNLTIETGVPRADD